ncbi:MAG: 3-hydroxyacyl-CoA dehydrogenase/enoyl-CoA hydratase family protein [Armatimonadetes bacterium]|nr:3-hydroxyacyl-CoA dehydrogenase/enoyl-CoA hydratase family protein [Armatimonadota bacterium]
MNEMGMSRRLTDGKKVCVIGAGTMGSGIAAHLANLGFQVSLLDVSDEAVREAFSKAKNVRPPHFFIRQTAETIRLGSIEKNLEWVSEADWVCEAIVEKLDLKKALFARLDPLLAPDALISTNTSGLELGLLLDGRSDSFKSRFFGTHFFNPPRYLKLLELIDTPATDPALLPVVTEFLEKRVGKRVVRAKDTPGFIANRFGMWSMFHAIHIAEKLQLSIELVDEITGPFLGRPKSASFRLNDMVGLDIMEDIASNQMARCPNDPYIGTLATPKSMQYLRSEGHMGNKAGKGYYQRVGQELLVFDLQTNAYRPQFKEEHKTLADNARKPIGERIRTALAAKDEVGEFLRLYLLPTLRYADYLKKEISYSVADFDHVMQWGFGWELGPFGLTDAIGSDLVLPAPKQFYIGSEQLRVDESGLEPVPSQPEYRSLSEYPVTEEHGSLLLRDLGDGVSSIEFSSKMGVVTTHGVEDLHRFLDEGRPGPFVLANSGRAFSVGFDLHFFLEAIETSNWRGIENSLKRLQGLGEKLSHSPVVAAVHGYALGGGFELAMNCRRVVALSDATIGLPEAKVGLLPGGRGVTLMRLRSQHSPQIAKEAALNLIGGTTFSNAVEAKVNGYLTEDDVVCFHPDLLITKAKELALTVGPREEIAFKSLAPFVNGMIEEEVNKKLKDGTLTTYDDFVGNHIRFIFAKSMSYEDLPRLEVERFLQLCQRPETKARILHMLEFGKPLRN